MKTITPEASALLPPGPMANRKSLARVVCLASLVLLNGCDSKTTQTPTAKDSPPAAAGVRFLLFLSIRPS